MANGKYGNDVFPLWCGNLVAFYSVVLTVAWLLMLPSCQSQPPLPSPFKDTAVTLDRFEDVSRLFCTQEGYASMMNRSDFQIILEKMWLRRREAFQFRSDADSREGATKCKYLVHTEFAAKITSCSRKCSTEEIGAGGMFSIHVQSHQSQACLHNERVLRKVSVQLATHNSCFLGEVDTGNEDSITP